MVLGGGGASKLTTTPPLLRAPVGKTSSCTGHSYGLNGIGMRRGAQYKVLSTIYNILGRVSLIRHTCVGRDKF